MSNTTPTREASEVLAVTQADREAVQAFHRAMLDDLMADIKSKKPSTLGDDKGDAGNLVQAFARHRIEALASISPTPPAVGEGEVAVLLDTDNARLALWKAIQSIQIGNPTDDKLIIANLAKQGVYLASNGDAK